MSEEKAIYYTGKSCSQCKGRGCWFLYNYTNPDDDSTSTITDIITCPECKGKGYIVAPADGIVIDSDNDKPGYGKYKDAPLIDELLKDRKGINPEVCNTLGTN